MAFVLGLVAKGVVAEDMLKTEECYNVVSASFFYFIIELWVGFVNLIQSNWSDSSLEDDAGCYSINNKK